MFIPYIAGIIVLLIITSYMATSSIVSDTSKIKLAYDKVTYVYPKEQVIVTAVEDLCLNDPAYCKAKRVSGEISLVAADLVGYIPDTFNWSSNEVGGAVSGIKILNNDTTIRITQTIPEKTTRFIYLSHYEGRSNGISPYCVTGTVADPDVCLGTPNVQHDHPTSLEFRIAIQ